MPQCPYEGDEGWVSLLSSKYEEKKKMNAWTWDRSEETCSWRMSGVRGQGNWWFLCYLCSLLAPLCSAGLQDTCRVVWPEIQKKRYCVFWGEEEWSSHLSIMINLTFHQHMLADSDASPFPAPLHPTNHDSKQNLTNWTTYGMSKLCVFLASGGGWSSPGCNSNQQSNHTVKITFSKATEYWMSL